MPFQNLCDKPDRHKVLFAGTCEDQTDSGRADCLHYQHSLLFVVFLQEALAG